jgi:hypothetical protein
MEYTILLIGPARRLMLSILPWTVPLQAGQSAGLRSLVNPR